MAFLLPPLIKDGPRMLLSLVMPFYCAVISCSVHLLNLFTRPLSAEERNTMGLNLSAINSSRVILTLGPQTLISDGLILASFGAMLFPPLPGLEMCWAPVIFRQWRGKIGILTSNTAANNRHNKIGMKNAGVVIIWLSLTPEETVFR